MDETGPTEEAKELLDIGRRKPFLEGDLLDGEALLLIHPRQLEETPEAILFLRRNLHSTIKFTES
jgi:hypothetical protein